MKSLKFFIPLTIIFAIIGISLINSNVISIDLEGITTRISSIINPQSDFNSLWRLTYWTELINFATNDFIKLIFGNGFNLTEIEKFNFSYQQHSIVTTGAITFHNSYIYIVIKTGIIGLLIFFAIIKNSFKKKVSNRNRYFSIKLALIGMLIFAGFNVVFENPYYGFFIWFFIGLLYSYNKEGIYEKR